jgi:hypothetical protein
MSTTQCAFRPGFASRSRCGKQSAILQADRRRGPPFFLFVVPGSGRQKRKNALPLRPLRHRRAVGCRAGRVAALGGGVRYSHRYSRSHCRALVERAALGEPVPEDVREVMRLGPPYPIAPVGFLDTKDWPEEWSESAAGSLGPTIEPLAHAVAPGARLDSWLLRLDVREDGQEVTRYGEIVELPAAVGTYDLSCDCGCSVYRHVGERPTATERLCPVCYGERDVTAVEEHRKPLHLRETFASLADACNLLGQCGDVQMRRVLDQLGETGMGLERTWAA